MTKQEARKILVREAKIFKYFGNTPEDFINALQNEPWRLSANSVEDAYYLISEELCHIIPWVWNPVNG